jgi:serine protease Do
VRIQEVLSGSPAEAAKLEADDVITELDGKKVATLAELQQAVQARKIDQGVTLTVIRKDKEQKIQVTLGENPNE